MAVVVVTVDGRPSAWEALEWATAEAAAGGARLRIRHVVPHLVCGIDVSSVIDNAGGLDRAERMLREAVARSRAIAPMVEVSTEFCAGADAPVAADPGDVDEVLVVVAREPQPRLLRLRSAPALRASSRRQHPVAVAGLFPRTHGPSAARVVVAVEGGADPRAAARFALRSACRRRVGLTAMTACGRASCGCCDASGWCNEPSACLCAALLASAPLFPGVETRFSRGQPCLRAGLVEESRGAALVVLGLRTRGRLRRAFAGTLEATALRSAAPVVLVAAGSRTA